MKILILTGNFGMGHVSVSEALKDNILAMDKNATVYIVDMFEYMFPSFSKIIYKEFNFIVRKCSRVYNLLNKLFDRYSNVPLKTYLANKMESLINEYNADLVLSTLPASSHFISVYKETYNSKIPLYTYITDITAHEEWVSQYTDMYFVGSLNTKNMLITKGIPEDKIKVSGIPVKDGFKSISKPTNSKQKHVLIMGGGLGIIPSYEQLLSSLTKKENLKITVICGNNEKLYNNIKKNYSNINVIKFTKQVYEYMKNADLVITKSGGITTFEAIYSETPMYILYPFLLQEVGNAEYIESLNIGRVNWCKNKDVAEDVVSLLENEKLICDMKNNMKDIKNKIESFSPVPVYKNKCYQH